MAYVVMAYIVMACVVMAYIVMAYVVMAYIVMACELGLAMGVAEQHQVVLAADIPSDRDERVTKLHYYHY